MSLQQLSEYGSVKHLWRDEITLKPGVYEITEPIIVDPGVATIGGKQYHTRGKGPDIMAHGVTLKLSRDFQGDCAIKFVGVHPNVFGLHVDARKVAIPFGLVMEGKMVGTMRQASGGRGCWTGLTIEGPFSKAAVHFMCAEEMSFYGANVYSTGIGNALRFENDVWSQTAVAIHGASLYAYGNDVVKAVGSVNDIRITDTFAASPKNLVDASEAQGYNNLFDGRFECSKTSQLLVGSQNSGWSLGTTRLLVSPHVSSTTPIVQ